MSLFSSVCSGGVLSARFPVMIILGLWVCWTWFFFFLGICSVSFVPFYQERNLSLVLREVSWEEFIGLVVMELCFLLFGSMIRAISSQCRGGSFDSPWQIWSFSFQCRSLGFPSSSCLLFTPFFWPLVLSLYRFVALHLLCA